MKPIGEIRLKNLETLIREFGTMEALAVAAGTTSVYLSQVRRRAIDIKTGKPREIGSRMARRLEAAGKNPKPPGWMDAEYQHVETMLSTEDGPAPDVGPPAPPAIGSGQRRLAPTDSEWAILDSIRAFPQEERDKLRAELRAKADYWERIAKELLAAQSDKP